MPRHFVIPDVGGAKAKPAKCAGTEAEVHIYHGSYTRLYLFVITIDRTTEENRIQL